MTMMGKSTAMAALALLIGAASPVAAAEEATIRAFAAWQGAGNLFETGASEVTFVGALTGTMYIDTDKGPLASGAMVCPVVVTINTDDGSQDAKGRCVISAKDGARVYATIACTGIRLIGCDGDFTLTGGTGRFKGIAGGGRVNLRSEFDAITPVSKAAAQEQGEGILYLRELHYPIP